MKEFSGNEARMAGGGLSNDRRFTTLLGRVQRTFQEASPDQVIKRVRAIVGTDRLPGDDPDGELAKQALDALKQGTLPSPTQQAALELMLRLMRPAQKVRDGKIEPFSEKQAEQFNAMFPDWEAFQAIVSPFVRSVGRVETAGGTGQGTGFLVDEETLVTNRHVLDVISSGTRRLERGQAQISFRKEFRTEDEDAVAIIGVKAVHPSQDIALLQLDRVEISETRRPLAIATLPPTTGDPVVTIGFPFDDSVRNPAFIGIIFGNQFGIKRAAPGDAVEVFSGQALWEHDCSTLGGNSGSPVVSMKTAQVVGLHFGGTFLWRNEALDAPAIARFVGSNS